MINADIDYVVNLMVASQREHVIELAHHIVDVMIPGNPSGFTLDPLTINDPRLPRNRYPETYFVSVHGREQVFVTIPHFSQVRHWLEEQYGLLCIVGTFVGFWPHGGAYYLDVTQAICGRSQAMELARCRSQKAIHHPFSGKSIPVEALQPNEFDGLLSHWRDQWPVSETGYWDSASSHKPGTDTNSIRNTSISSSKVWQKTVVIEATCNQQGVDDWMLISGKN